jgi:CheY-like chemotaxis protein
MQIDRPEVLIVEDDPSLGLALEEYLSTTGGEFRVLRAETVQQALDFAEEHPGLRFIYLDMAIPIYEPFTEQEAGKDGRRAGLPLLRKFAELLPKAKVYVKTQTYDFSRDLVEYLYGLKSVISVVDRVDRKDIQSRAKAVYSDQGIRPEILIVHGRDTLTLQSLQSFIQYELKLGKPKILRNLPDIGRTVIEKFEHYARQMDLVFALMTDDDLVGDNWRARQNVIFEIGYFIGAFGRQSRKLIIIKKGDVEIPSDMGGMILIDITHGYNLENFQRELEGWLAFSGD